VTKIEFVRDKKTRKDSIKRSVEKSYVKEKKRRKV
jgi:hypothetical protein